MICPECGRRPSERYARYLGGGAVESYYKPCAHPTHDLADRAPEAFEMLREREWESLEFDGDGGPVEACFVCKGMKPNHKNGCKLAALLSVTPAEGGSADTEDDADCPIHGVTKGANTCPRC